MFKHRKSHTDDGYTDATTPVPIPAAGSGNNNSTPPSKPDWCSVLLRPIIDHSVAPSDDDILFSYTKFCDELDFPFLEIEQEWSMLYAELVDSIVALKSIAPEQVERALAQHAIEYSRPSLEEDG